MGIIKKYLYKDELIEHIAATSIILIGAGRIAQSIVDNYSWNIKYAIDNNSKLWGNELKGRCTTISIHGWDFLRDNCCAEDVFILTPVYSDGLVKQIESDSRLQNNEIILYSYIWSVQWDMDRIKASQVPFEITSGSEELIPKIIHFFWFSDDPYTEDVKRCLDSWHKHCPDYEFIKWDLSNYNTKNAFCNEALSKGRWAYASDFGRCDVLYRYGGIYLDSDVELIKPLDELLYDKAFFAFESARGVDPGSGMGTVKGNPVFDEIRKQYEGVHYLNADGTENRLNILDQYTDVLIKHGLITNGQYQKIEDMAVYPPLVFSPYSYRTGITSAYEKTYAIHHWVSSWITEGERRESEERREYISRRIGSLLDNNE